MSPLMHRCHLCGQDWWDAHVCPHLPKMASKPLSADSISALEGGYDFQRKRADAAEAKLSKAMDLLWDAAEYVEIEAEHGDAKAKDLVAAIDRFRDEVMP